MVMMYNQPNTTPASIDKGANGTQFNTYYWLRKALIEEKKKQYFSQLADTINMPKHMGKEIVRYQYWPLLDDRNINDQGIDATGAVIADGNLYGSSKDIGKITGKFPVLSESGGKVNRVGFARSTRKGTVADYGLHVDWSEDAIQFDTDSELMSHMTSELVKGVTEMQEDMLQIDLLNAAGQIVYPGSASSRSDLDSTCTLSYKNLQKLDQYLTDAHTDVNTKVITGSRMVDTKVIPAARVAYVGSELAMYLQDMKDNLGRPAWRPVEQYGAATTLLNGEIGSIYRFRIIQVEKMLFWEGAGAAVSSGDTVEMFNDGSKYNVYPFLVVGNDAFNTVGFQSSGSNGKFKMYRKNPGIETADRINDPYGKMGFMSLQFWYGFMVNRPERIGLIPCVCPV